MTVIADAATVGGFLLIAAIALGFTVLAVRRQNRIRRFAKEHGLLYASGDPQRLADREFRLLRLGDGRRCEDSVWGLWNGVQVTEAEFSYWKTDRDGSQGHRHLFSVAAVEVGSAVPFVSIRETGLAA